MGSVGGEGCRISPIGIEDRQHVTDAPCLVLDEFVEAADGVEVKLIATHGIGLARDGLQGDVFPPAPFACTAPGV